MTDRTAELVLAAADDCGALAAFELAMEIEAASKGAIFTAPEILAHAKGNARLSAVMTRTLGELSGRKLGQWCARWEGRSLGRLRVERRGTEENFVLWAVTTQEHPHEPRGFASNNDTATLTDERT